MEAVIFSSYFPPLQYFSKLISYDNIYIDIFENYQRQTYRNRCEIQAANGKEILSVPIIKQYRTPIKDTKIDYSENWQKIHYKSIFSAYKNSAFCEHYLYEFNFVFQNTNIFLLDLNNKILEKCFKILNLKSNYYFSTEFIKPNIINDFREVISPKAKIHDLEFSVIEYFQVFKERHGFMKNLSILDLIFNEGPNSAKILQNSCLKI